MSDYNTIYIISKGRPHCTTAQTLSDLDYQGDWFICCGNNDETVPEYLERWGDRVIVYDWRKYAEKTNTLDNFGIDNFPTGVPPVREAVREISENRGEKRHWQFDDDMETFYIKHPITRRKLQLDGYLLEKYLNKLATFAYETGMSNIGFFYQHLAFPPSTFQVTQKNLILHNLPTNKSDFVEWKGRMCDDLINIIETYKYGFCQLCFGFMNYGMKEVLTESGGSTEMYLNVTQWRKTSYPILINPLSKMIPKKGGIHLQVPWGNTIPKLVSEKYKRE